jgi:D-beta-D-heptose 7-phosphate kinase/D-beta-D-heptose 1-phosphate adenosyltransferase
VTVPDSHDADPYDAGPDDARLTAILAACAGRTVLVLGDVMLDRYVVGEVRRISPEAPIPVLKATHRRSVAGGAANVAHNVATLSGRAILVSAIGADAGGEELTALLDAIPGVSLALRRIAGRPTTTKTRFVSHGQQLLRLDEERADPIEGAEAAAILDAFAAALPGADCVVLSDYAKGVLSDEVLAGAIARARAAGVPVVADPKRVDLAAYRGATVLTPNQGEIAAATGVNGADDAAVAAAGALALREAAVEAVLVTRSERGVTLARPDRPPLHIAAQARAVADVSGAGDTLVAALALALGTGAPLPEAAALANLAAGLAVAKAGTATVGADELAETLHWRDRSAIDRKLIAFGPALALVAGWRRAGLRVGFTNGCFDLIHPGHVRLLARARAGCDRLVVGLNSDASVRRLKGASRPVQAEQARAVVLGALASTDLVVVFEEDTPERLIAALLPDVLFKGADYRLDQVVGADIVAAAGGEVRLIPLEEGHSTTAIIARSRG